MIQYRAKVNEPFGAPIKVGDLVEIDPSEWLDHSTSMLYFHDKGQKMWSGTKSTWDKYFEPVSRGSIPDFCFEREGTRIIPQDHVIKTSDGGPSDYYDFPFGAITLNDLIEHKNMDFHRGNIFKACWRFGTKEGTSKVYDARKIIYSGARILMGLVGVVELRKTLQKMLDDPQFQERN
jgi:hypothetical protein